MQSFSYYRKGDALRSTITMYLMMMIGDVVLFGVAGVVLPRPWNLVALAVGAGFVGLAVWLLTRGYRTPHLLDEGGLTLRFGRFRLAIPREAISEVSRWTEPVPRGVTAPTMPARYHDATDTLFLLAERKGLVVVDLNRPVAGRTVRQGAFECTRVVVSLDEPEKFVAAFAGGGAAPVPTAVRAPAGMVTWTPASPPGEGGSEGEGGAIRLEGLSRRFGDFAVVKSVSLSVAPGEVLAFLGSNGAGKTTTIRMMTGLLRPTGGRVYIGGRDVWAEGPAARRLFGYVPDVPLLYEGLTAREFLWLVAGLYDIPRDEGRRRAEELLSLLKMAQWRDQLLRNFSLGMKRKMAIAAALVHRPQVLLLDEVTNGLDPRATREVKDFISASARAGTAVFLTTHLLDVAQELAQRIAVIHRGELRALGTLGELRTLTGRPEAGLEELFLTLTEERAGGVAP
jgi:ABC-2 type transport system ATP-binding protein